VVVLCGQKSDVKEDNALIFDLVSMFPVDKAINEAKYCLEQLVLKNAPSFPGLKQIQSKL
jgi:hypothetical protein